MDALHNEDGAMCLFGRLESTHRDLIPLSCSFVDGTTEVNYGRTPQDVTHSEVRKTAMPTLIYLYMKA
jgi:hypothetical protein